ncbi:MAG: carboxymethylenebutenolidase [Alphaproteobacteria bacterium RIFCSPHIGHO2_12_FULL_63_12]|nr:MAG: carboxymethylenebutenolidase [Alphaproteobacteria bacterium RIFCSPHIGHO2_12_FULL_63_12]
MTVTTRAIDYSHDGKSFEGLLAVDNATSAKRPAVLISHAWAGRGPVEEDYAKRLASLGYAGFALDLYGKGVFGRTTEECQALMTPLAGNRPLLQARLLNAVEVVKKLPEVDTTKIVVMGFCFGGLCALDVARTGADIKGVASFHGLFGAPGNTKGRKIRAKVIAFHGWDDPMVKPDDVKALGAELTEAGADWQIHAYGGVMHAFTNPQANDPGFGTVYNKRAADRSWESMKLFLAECFA